MIHAAFVHMPIALAMLGVPLVYVCAVFQSGRKVLATVAVICYAMLAATAYAAVWTGEKSRDLVPPTISAEAAEVLTDHADWAEYLWIAGLVTAVLMLVSMLKWRSVRMAATGLAMVSSLVTAGWIGLVGHYGGTLVYTYGIGTALFGHEAPASSDTPGAAPASDMADAEDAEPLIPIRMIDLDAEAPISYVNDIQPLFEDACMECHEGKNPDSGYDMTTIANIMQEGKKKLGPNIVPGNADASPIVKYVRGEYQPRMPEDEDPLTEGEVHMVRVWIAQGAQDDSAQDKPAAAEAETDSESVVDLF